MAVATKKAAPARKAAAPARKARVAVGVADSYFAGGDTDLEFVSSGCAVMDCALGGGYALGRTVNIVGDRSAGKTLCAMEITANFHLAFAEGASRYAESEAAFDQRYAAALGIPVDRIEFNSANEPMRTIEDLYDDMVRFMDRHKGKPKLYIIDSLDALSDDKEIEDDFDKDSMGGKKPKLVGQLFRRLVERMEAERMLFVVVSQIRENMTAGPFQEKHKRSGGKALDFYATHIVWINEVKKIKRTVGGIERVTGVDVKARVRKNKVGLPFRECEYPILFGYGIDDLTASVEWLIENRREELLASVGLSKAGHAVLLRQLRDRGGPEVREMRRKLTELVRAEWRNIEVSFLPQSRKY